MKPKTILLVEDNPDDVELTRLAFAKNHLANDLKVARDGEEALDLLFGQSEDPSAERVLPALILLDLKLPKIDGLEVLRKIRAEPTTAFLPVVVLTSSKDDKDLISSYQLGCNSYIRKPVEFSRFVEATRQLGIYWLLLNEQPPPSP